MAKFTVWNPETGDADDGKVFEAFDDECAAEQWAAREDSWSAEYLIVSGRDEPVVHVKDEHGNVTRFKVTGESVPTYYARPVERTEPEGGNNG
ncbi:hypothetical protein [Cupriavidus pauculus]|uniref:hypothetical protein n=1 Tax=Cupriavidus pauculus TaxID=82633 RepID=UPI00078422BF|nr:hypothetical protein [Cupriavidus pauculus]